MLITIKKFKDFQNKWVAIDEKTEEIITSGTSLVAVQEEAAKNKEDVSNVSVLFIYPFNTYIAPSCK